MYKFTLGAVLYINSLNSDMNLRSPVGSNGAVDGKGGTGVAAKWYVYTSVPIPNGTNPNYRLVQLAKYEDQTYFLRIYNNTVDAAGTANQVYNYLRIYDISAGVVYMQSNMESDQRIGILADGSVKTPDTVNFGISAQFVPIDTSYTFSGGDRQREVVRVTHIESGQTLRVNMDGSVDPEGGRGQLSFLILEIANANKRTDDGDGGDDGKDHKDRKEAKEAKRVEGHRIIRLRSATDPSKYIRILDDGTVDARGEARDEEGKTLLVMKKVPVTQAKSATDSGDHEFAIVRGDHPLMFVRGANRHIFRIAICQ